MVRSTNTTSQNVEEGTRTKNAIQFIYIFYRFKHRINICFKKNVKIERMESLSGVCCLDSNFFGDSAKGQIVSKAMPW